MNRRVPILFFGNLPPPYGGLSTYFAFMTPRLIELGFEPIILLREAEPYDLYRSMGAVVYRLPHDAETQIREVELLRSSVSSDALKRCLAIRQEMEWLLEDERFLSDTGFAIRIGRHHGVKLVHTFHAYHRSVAALAANQVLGCPILLTIFGEVVSRFALESERKTPLRRFFSSFDALLSTSNHCARGVLPLGMSTSTVNVIPYGVDLTFFRERPSHKLRSQLGLEGKQIILFQGRISAEKGPDVLLRAVPTVVEALPEAVVLFVGPDEGPGFDGPTGLGEELARRVVSEGLSRHVRIIGSVPFEHLPSYYSLADVLVFPSISDKECMGLSIKQAMACSRPVIVARAGGACEAVEDGVTGYCIQPNDHGALAQSLIAMLGSNSRERMGRAGYQRAIDLFSEDRTVKATVNLYEALMERAALPVSRDPNGWT